MKIIKRILITVLVFVLAGALAFGVYVNDYYHAKAQATEILETNHDFKITNNKDEEIIFMPKHPKAGLIFYPGGKVQYESYVPLIEKLAENDILCILVHMPCNLAVFNINDANGYQKKYKNIKNWYIAGHSLGGAMACSYLGDHNQDYKGLILLGSYSTVNLRKSHLKVLSIYGSEDKVLSQEKYKKNYKNLPKDSEEYIIKGGCHSYFGNYGKQDGDGKPTITRNRQLTLTTNKILDLINKDCE